MALVTVARSDGQLTLSLMMSKNNTQYESSFFRAYGIRLVLVHMNHIVILRTPPASGHFFRIFIKHLLLVRQLHKEAHVRSRRQLRGYRLEESNTAYQ